MRGTCCGGIEAAGLKRFKRSEEGGITIFSLYLLLGFLFLGGLAIDVYNGVRSRTQLQVAADSAAHAALFWRYRHSEAESVAKGIEFAEENMPTSIFGNVLVSTDVEFGTFDWVDRDFAPVPGSDTAVRVTTRRVQSRANALSTFLMSFIGVDELELNTASVWDSAAGFCPPRSPDKKRGEGFFALDVVEMQTDNTYLDGFCVHSETHVKFSENSFFQDGVTVSMPDETDLQIPNSGFETNVGLEDALTSMSYNLQAFFNELPDTIAAYANPYSPLQPSYVTDKTQAYSKNFKSGDFVTAADVVPNAVNIFTCNGSRLTIAENEVLSNAVIVTNCEIKMNAGSAIENMTMVTSSSSLNSLTAPEGTRFGATTFCNDGAGGATVMTLGNARFASQLKAFGTNLIAAGDIGVASDANGLAGINFMAGGRIDMTTGATLGFCNFGPPDAFPIPVFRMVM